MAEIRKIVPTQLNEKVSNDEYDVLHPETRADLIKETYGNNAIAWEGNKHYNEGEIVVYSSLNNQNIRVSNAYQCINSHTASTTFNTQYWRRIRNLRFVTPEDENRWGRAVVSMSYKGDYSSSTTYSEHDIVSYPNNITATVKEYFLCLQNCTGIAPDLTSDTTYWKNINLGSSYIRTINAQNTNSNYYITFVSKDNINGDFERLYTDASLQYNPNTNKLSVMAEYAEVAKDYDTQEGTIGENFISINEFLDKVRSSTLEIRTSNMSEDEVGFIYNPSDGNSQVINLEISATEINNLADFIVTEGKEHFVRYDTAQQELLVQEDDTPEVIAMKLARQSIARQNINAQIAGDYAHLINGRIPENELPDSILGQLEYGGTVNCTTGVIISEKVEYNNRTIANSNPLTIIDYDSSVSTPTGCIVRFTDGYCYETRLNLPAGTTVNNFYSNAYSVPLRDEWRNNFRRNVSVGDSIAVGDIAFINGMYRRCIVAHTIQNLSYTSNWNVISSKVYSVQASGTYFIVEADNTIQQGTLVGISCNVGDWLLSNGEGGWTKIDNTDAVTMVNDQIGAIYTYKGEWNAQTNYYRGDWVLHDGVLYLAILTENNINKTPSDAVAYWQIAGRVYTASKGLTIIGDDIQHSTRLLTDINDTETEVNPETIINIPIFTIDEYGHIIQRTNKNYKIMGNWRPIQVNGTVLLQANSNTPLNLVNGSGINLVGNADGSVIIKHTNNVLAKNSYEDVTANSLDGSILVKSVSYDTEGHVNNIIDQKIINLATQHGDQNWYDNRNLYGNFVPGNHNTYNLGSESAAWKNIYATNFYGNLEGRADGWSTPRAFLIKVSSGVNIANDAIVGSDTQSVDGTNNSGYSWNVSLGNSGVVPGAYSVVGVNEKGIVIEGGQMLQYGHGINTDPTDTLVEGGLFFRMIEAPLV